MITLVILISGRGSNLTSLLNAAASGAMPARIVGVISNRPDALGLQTAEAHGVPTCVIDHRGLPSANNSMSRSPRQLTASHQTSWCWQDSCGFSARLSCVATRDRLINIHPSLLPAFPGLHTHRRALAEGVRIHGCTVHFVTPDLDHGPIIRLRCRYSTKMTKRRLRRVSCCRNIGSFRWLSAGLPKVACVCRKGASSWTRRCRAKRC
jgi:phosphoribosylglycinamide formyltransferase-1